MRSLPLRTGIGYRPQAIGYRRSPFAVRRSPIADRRLLIADRRSPVGVQPDAEWWWADLVVGYSGAADPPTSCSA
jgi:hypothetical protein